MQIRILNVNALDGGIYFKELLKFIKDFDPDILTMQEVCHYKKPHTNTHYNTIINILENTKLKSYYFSKAYSNKFEDTYVDIGNAIFTKYKIIKSKTWFLRDKYKLFTEVGRGYGMNTPRNIQYCKIKLNKHTRIDIFNLQGIWHVHEKDTKARIRSAKLIANILKRVGSPIISGDFNIIKNSKTINIISNGLVNCHPDIKGTINTRMRKEGQYSPCDFSTFIIDEILVSPKYKIIESKLHDIDVSDHLPLSVILDV